MTINFGGVVVVPLQGAIVVCYGWGAEGDDQFWWSGRGAIAGCHCSVLWLGDSVVAKTDKYANKEVTLFVSPSPKRWVPQFVHPSVPVMQHREWTTEVVRS